MQQLAIALTAVLVVSATVLVHARGTYFLTRHLSRDFTDAKGLFTRRKALLALIWSATALLLLHVIEIHLWALTYLFIEPVDELTTFESDSYFSFVTFTTLGYGDITLAQHDWRILSGIEALNGILLAGWSTAFLFAVVHAHRDALREPYPLKGRADAGQQVVADAAVALGDPPADAIDPALQGLVGIGHQGDAGLQDLPLP